MSEEIEDLEKRLAKLKPLEQDALAATILGDMQSVGRGDSFTPPAYPPLVADIRSAAPRRPFASLSLCSGLYRSDRGRGGTFLGMTFPSPFKVEFREIVREVHARPEAKLAADDRSSLPASNSENQAFASRKAMRNLDDGPTLSGFSFRDLDALVAEREALARQMGRRDSPARSTSSQFVPPRISPEEYRELLRELRL